MKEVDIKLYTLSTCIHCKNTKEFLQGCGVDYNCVDVDTLTADERKAVLDEIKKVNPNCSFPTIIIGDKIIIGFRKEEIKEALNL